MKTYAGKRTIDGIDVRVDGALLPDAAQVKTFSEAGFEWGYAGDAPRQLALALLLDHLGDPAAAERASLDFMRRVVAVLDNEWTLTSDEISAALQGS